MATGGGQSLGSAQFVVQANTSQFVQGMTQAQQQATQTTKVIVDNFGGMYARLGSINKGIHDQTVQLTAALQALGQQFSTVVAASARSGSGIQQAGFGARSSAMGFLYLSQAIEDAQYGFSAIVNNIPLIVMGMGGGPGLAGVVSILAVGINLVVQHWDEFKSSFGDTSAFQTVQGSITSVQDALRNFDKSIGGTGNAWRGLREMLQQGLAETYHALTGAGEQFLPEVNREPDIAARMAQDRARREAEADKAIERFGKDEGGDKKQAHDFKEAMEAYGGGKKLQDEMFRRRVADMGGQIDAATGQVLFGGVEDVAREQAVRRQVAEQMVRGEEGRLGAGEIERFPGRLQDELRDVQMEKSRKEEEEINKKRRHVDEELTKKGEQFEKQMQLEQLHEQQEDMRKQFEREKHMLTGPQRQQLEDRIIGSKAPQEAKLMSTKAFVDATMTSGASQMPQKQLEKLVEMNNHLKGIEKKIDRVGRLE